MTTFFPSSTARISSGNLFFASAILKSIRNIIAIFHGYFTVIDTHQYREVSAATLKDSKKIAAVDPRLFFSVSLSVFDYRLTSLTGIERTVVWESYLASGRREKPYRRLQVETSHIGKARGGPH